MKARIKETGKWITVDPCDDGFYDVETQEIYEPDELDFASAFDWDIYRREVAKSVLLKMLIPNFDTDEFPSPQEVCANAVLYADELIKQLQGKTT